MPFRFLAPISSTDALFSGITLLVLLFVKQYRKSKHTLPYPPGPWPLPIIGNILEMPQTKFALTWTKFGEKYGPLTWLTIPGQNILVLNSFEAAKELLEKRPLIYSDRPRFVMLSELLGLGDYLAFSGYNATWRKQRAHLKQPLSASVIRSDYSSLLEAKAREYVERCVACPETFLVEVNRIVAEAILKLTYGRLEDGRGTDYIQINTHITDIVVLVMQGYVVDLLPALRHLPSWLPGMKFKRDAARWKREINDVERTVFESAKESTLSDDPNVKSSFTFKKLQEIYHKHEEGKDLQQQADDEMMVARSGLSFFLAGVETTQKTIESFICAMALFPSAHRKAQGEIDRVVGSDRFPAFNDQPSLPYLHALVLETLRWNPVASAGVPHASRQDDTYAGYFIPQGTSVIVNVWGISRNPEYYPDPSTFDPERHLTQPPPLDPREFFFGFGRRICPGKDLAFQQIWIMAASVLWAFRLIAMDEDRELLAEDLSRFTFELLNRPVPFRCQFVSRREALRGKLGPVTV